MAAGGKLAQIERERGKPINEILCEDLNQFGTLTAVAREWDISYRIVSELYTASGIALKRVYELPEAQSVQP